MEIEVTPRQQPAETPAQSPAPDEASSESGNQALPPELLQIPAMQAILAGQPAAVSAPLSEFSQRPEAAVVAKNKDALQSAGFGFYRSLSGDLAVVFNMMHIHPDEIVNADKAGQLTQVAPPFDAVNDAVAKSGADHPILKTDSVPNGFKSAPMPQATGQINSAQPAPAPASTQKKLATARTNNLAVGSPTSGPSPGAGRILNSIFKPVI